MSLLHEPILQAMLKKLSSILSKNKKPVTLQQLNRQRFEYVHSGKRFNSLKKIYEKLLKDDQSLTDQKILDNYYKFSNNIQTNTFASAEIEWVTISVLCYYRPNLTEELMRRGLLSIVYSLGDDIESYTVLQFINQRILVIDAEPAGGLPPESGLKWLTEILPTQKDRIQKVLDEVIEQNRHELGKI